MVVAGLVEEAEEDVGDGRSGGGCWGSAAGVGLVERRRRRKKIGWIAIPGCQGRRLLE